jgi:hypothetical protein
MKKDLSRMNKLSLFGKFVLTVVTTLVVLQLVIQKPSSAQQPARDRLGVGDIVMSPLNLQQFRAQHGVVLPGYYAMAADFQILGMHR